MVYGFGINDVTGDSGKHNKNYKIYQTWHSMLKRCYSKTHLSKYPTYIGTIVCDEWKYYSKFKEWYLQNYKEGYVLDKDLIDGTKRIYSPDTCSFVPELINNSILDGKPSSYPLGVTYYQKSNGMINERKKPFHSHIKKYGKRIYINTHETMEEAHKSWQIEKCKYLIELIYKYKNDVIPEVIHGLQRRIDILNDDIINNRETKSISKV